MKKSRLLILLLSALSTILLIILLTLITSCNNKRDIEVYFCYYDDCAARIEEEIRQASQNIYFMSYTFTNGRIASDLILKSREGVDVKGILESRNINTRNSKYELLRFQGIDIKTDNNPGLMHHKVFIIDNKLVITGSFNPSEAGNRRNDDNMVIIRDQNIAKEYLEEFRRVFVE